MLSIYEVLLLLALDEEKGNILPVAKPTLAHGISGAILADLALRGKVSTNSKYYLELQDAGETGDALLDEALRAVQSSEKPRKLSYWVSELSQKPKEQRRRVGEQLVGKNVLSREEKRFFWKASESQEGANEPTNKYEIKQPLRKMILTNTDADVHSLALLHIADAAGLLPLIFTPDELPHARRRIQEGMTMKALENPGVQLVEEIDEAIAASLEDDRD